MSENPEPQPAQPDSKRRILIISLIGVIVVGVCALFFLASMLIRTNQVSLFENGLSSPTSESPNQLPPASLTATQQAWIVPDASPTLGSADEAKEAFADDVYSDLDFIAFINDAFPAIPDITQPGDVYIFEIPLAYSEPLFWIRQWCTTTQAILDENFNHIQIDLVINGVSLSTENIVIIDTQNDDGSTCRNYVVLIKTWTSGQHHLEAFTTFTQDINDGWNVYPAGIHIFKYIVTYSATEPTR